MSNAPTAGAAPPPAEDPRPTSEVIASLIANGQGLVKTELELAKLEVKRIVTEKATAIGLSLAAGLLGLYVLAFAGVTGAAALSTVLPAWAAWLIVTGIYLLIMVILLLLAIRLFKRPTSPERTRAELERTRDWAKEQVATTRDDEVTA